MKYLYIILFCIIICHPSLAQINEKSVEETYAKIQTLYPEVLVNHFINMENLPIVYLHVDYPGSTRYQSQIHVMFLCDEELKKKIEGIVKKQSVQQYHFSDSCLMIVAYDSTIYDSRLLKIEQCCSFSRKLPIPNFQYFFEAQLPFEFYEKANIYVLDAQKGNFLKEDYLSVENIKLPNGWEHGYTKGVLISENLISFWMEVW